MFTQVIEGTITDPDEFDRMLDRWETDVRPGAIGYLGSTAGCTPSGEGIIVARFEDRDAAMRNSARPEQDAWWREMEPLFASPPRFHETEVVHVMQHGDLDHAGFVQVMEGHVSDRERAIALEDESDELLSDQRPDLLGSVTMYFEDDEFTSLAYFTSEDEARAGERASMPDEMADAAAKWEKVMRVEHYLDVDHPHLTSA